MKHFAFAFLTVLLFVSSAAQSQAPQAFKYQAVVRNAAGQVLANQSVGLKITLLGTGDPYVAVHNVTTNAFGLVNLEIGRGTLVSGNFSQINWAQETIYVQLSLDATGGTNYQNIGTSELLSVPYALYAANSGNGLPAGAQTGDIAYYNGTAWQRLPAGVAGSVLTMGEDGLPAWTQLNSLIKVPMTNGDVIYTYPSDNSTGVTWGSYGNITALPDVIASPTMDFNGETNTNAIVAQLGTNNGTPYAAKICADLVAYGFDDWYLPAAGELNEMHNKLGPLGFGGSGQMPTGGYWSSSEYGTEYAWGKGFDDGLQILDIKLSILQCRCVRR